MVENNFSIFDWHSYAPGLSSYTTFDTKAGNLISAS